MTSLFVFLTLEGSGVHVPGRKPSRLHFVQKRLFHHLTARCLASATKVPPVSKRALSLEDGEELSQFQRERVLLVIG